MKTNNPYKECLFCKDLGDCPHPDVSNDTMGVPLPPDEYPKPIEIIKQTINKRKLKHFTYGLS